MLKDFIWNMTGYIPKHQVNPHGDGIIPYVAERIFRTGTGAASGGQSERIHPVCLTGKEPYIFLILPAPLRAAAQQAHQRLSRCGRRRFVRHRPIYRYKTLLPGANAPKADGL